MDYRVGIQANIRRAVLITMMIAVLPQIVFSQDADDLTTVSLENLLNMQVTSVSRQQEELRSTAAAVYVITQEDIRRSGVTEIADLLRMAPGVNVAQITSNTWAVSVRGFNAQYATKLLVLVDGRTVYDPGFSGVFWHLQNLVLEDIDRIEVIRGPGATMWGANAVNGVISITTKRASETQGGLFVADAGSNRPAEGSLRYGGTIGRNAFYRVFGKQTTRSDLTTESGANGGDAWNMTDAGFRLDWSLSKSDSITLDAAGYRGVTGSNLNILTSLAPLTYQRAGLLSNSGGHIMTRWNRSLNDSSNLTVQFFYNRRHHGGYGAKDLSVLDFDLQHNVRIGSRHDVIWGLGHRKSSDEFSNSLAFGMNPASKDTALTSAFVQDEITLAPGKVSFAVGAKYEHSSFTQSNLQPTARLSWTPTARQSTWVSASRAVRTANRVERGMYLNVAAFPTGPSSVGVVDLYGQEDARSEGLLAYEAGYRYQANRRLWIDVTTFYTVYDDLSIVEAGAPFFAMTPQPPHLVTPLYFGNAMKGETYGAELVANYKVNPVLSFRSSYSLLRMTLHATNAAAADSERAEGESPRNQFYLGSFLTLPKSFEVSGHTYFAGSLDTGNIPSHTRIDLNVAWKKLENLELSVAGQNLLGKRTEFAEFTGPANPVRRSVYGKMTWRF